MVDDAVSLYGSNRTEHLLTTVRSVIRYAGDTLVVLHQRSIVSCSCKILRSCIACVITVAGILTLAACQDSSHERGSSQRALDSADWLALIPGNQIETGALAPIGFPADLMSHPEQRAESFVLRAFLYNTQGEPVSVQAQWDRATVKVHPGSSSEWAFTDVMRASLTIGEPMADAPVHRETLSRSALGLAASDVAAIYVHDIQLQIEADDLCDANYRVSGTTQDGRDVSLTWRLSSCPDVQSLGNMRQWSANALSVTGQVVSSQGAMVVEGRGWLLHRYGSLPSRAGAVVLDEASLLLDNRLTLDISRSRRRSGRGPQTILATLTKRDEALGAPLATESIDLQWRDEAPQVSARSGISYPTRIIIDSEEHGISLQMSALVAVPEISDEIGMRWDGAVIVRGSHQGYGFVTLNPVPQGDSH